MQMSFHTQVPLSPSGLLRFEEQTHEVAKSNSIDLNHPTLHTMPQQIIEQTSLTMTPLRKIIFVTLSSLLLLGGVSHAFSSSQRPIIYRSSSSTSIAAATPMQEAAVGNMHGQGSCFLPLLQNDDEYIAPRIVQVRVSFVFICICTKEVDVSSSTPSSLMCQKPRHMDIQ
jgi:hypothetical protein